MAKTRRRSFNPDSQRHKDDAKYGKRGNAPKTKGKKKGA